MKRITDLLLTIIATLIFLLPLAAIALVVRLTSKGPAMYWSERVGRNN